MMADLLTSNFELCVLLQSRPLFLAVIMFLSLLVVSVKLFPTVMSAMSST